MTKALCGLCGEPMPDGEEMLKYHGYSGPCPAPPKPAPRIDTIVEYIYREADGAFWLDIHMDRQPWAQLGPFETEAARHAAKADLLNMMRSVGAKDLPGFPQ